MSTIRIKPDGRLLEAADGESILTATLRHGVEHSNACGGHGRCSTYRVMITEGLDRCSGRTQIEQKVADHLGLPDEIRLACQTVASGEVSARRLVLDTLDIDLTTQIIENPPVEIVGIEKEVCILFADIRSFTAFAEALLPYDVIFVLNRYFRLMEEILVRHHGFIDNYMGDGFLALFEGDSKREVAISAISAALEMLSVVEKDLHPYSESLFGQSFDIGIGIHYGLVVAGSVGGKESRKVTVIGDAVNFASRVESANKVAGTRLLVSDEVAKLVEDVVTFGKTSSIEIRGKSGEHTLHEVLASEKKSPKEQSPIISKL